MSAMKAARPVVALLCLGVMLAVSGCSGTGATTAQVAGGPVAQLAANHLSCLSLVKAWFNLLYDPTPSPGVIEVDYEFFDDGSYRARGTNSDHSTFDWRMNADTSGYGITTWPDGIMEETWGPESWEGLTYTQDTSIVFPDGSHFAYTTHADLGTVGTPQTKTGSATLSDGRAMGFALDRKSGVRDRLALNLPDGSHLELQLPITWRPGNAFWPVFTAGATGSYTPASGSVLSFRVKGTVDGWNEWTFAAADGCDGQFAVRQDDPFALAGSGTLAKGASLLGALRWDANGEGTLEQASAAAADVSPCAAARDFCVNQWLRDVAMLGPAPMY